MIRAFVVLVPMLFVLAYLELAQFASLLPNHKLATSAQSDNHKTVILLNNNNNIRAPTPPPGDPNRPTLTSTITDDQADSPVTTAPPTSSTSTLKPTTTTVDADADDQNSQPAGSTAPPPSSDNNNPARFTTASPNPSQVPNSETKPTPPSRGDNAAAPTSGSTTDLSVLFYSIFIVYVSSVKLLYHNVNLIRRNMTEPAILILFGIIWDLILRQTSVGYSVFPRFNPQIFFYLFLPSTVLESASLLSNKWLFLNLVPIIIHSVLGTLLFASSLGFTIYSLGQGNVFNLVLQNNLNLAANQTTVVNGRRNDTQQPAAGNQTVATPTLTANAIRLTQSFDPTSFRQQPEPEQSYQFLAYASAGAASLIQLEHNLTLSDCLVFATILSSVDSTSMLNVLKAHQVNEKLYYLVLGESLMNNAVVLVLFDLLLDFFEATRLTVVKIYITILQFFTTLIGSVFIGLLLASIALVSVRLTKRLQVQNPSLSSYQNQCQAMVETLLIMKLAYLTYTVAPLASTSNILSLVTFGILEDQYIKQNLNLRSQLTFRQVVLATKTMGYSLVYPLIGMLLVEVANMSQFFVAWLSADQQQQQHASGQPPAMSSSIENSLASSLLDAPTTGQQFADTIGGLEQPSRQQLLNQLLAAGGGEQLAQEQNFKWNFKFISIVTILAILYRFVIVIALGSLSNLLMSGQLRLKFKEQIMMAFGGLKGPLTIALVYKFIDHQAIAKDRTSFGNKHLFTCTVLFIIFVTTVVNGSFLRPLVSRVQAKLVRANHQSLGSGRRRAYEDEQDDDDDGDDYDDRAPRRPPTLTIVFDEINCKLCEHVSNGLNSVLGRSRSSYDKFVEFNELHIKRWLTREGSNKHWLGIFYDDLILNETLNSDCFHFVTEDPTTMRTFRNQQRLRQQQQESRRRLSNMTLDTIEEHKPATSRAPRKSHVALLNSPLDNQMWPLQFNSSGDSSSSAAFNRRTASKLLNLDDAPSMAAREKTLLREYILLNLKLEQDKERTKAKLSPRTRAASRRKNATGFKVSPSTSKKQLSPPTGEFARSRLEGERNRSGATFERMLSSTSSGGGEAQEGTERDSQERHRMIEVLADESTMNRIDLMSSRHQSRSDNNNNNSGPAVVEPPRHRKNKIQPKHKRGASRL